MQKLSQESITALLQTDTRPKATLYIPMENTATPPHITENQIRFKNMIHRAQAELASRGDKSALSQELSGLLDKHFDDMNFWKSQSRGLLVLASPGVAELFSLPVDTEEYVAIDDTFHLAPVLALLSDNHEYYLLVLAQQHPKLFRGNMYGLEYVDAGLPATLRSSLGIDEVSLQSENQGSASGSSMKAGWFNGRGGARDPQDADRLKFFHLIDKLLHEHTDRSLPLVLAGTDAEIAEFRDLSKYLRILQGSITGNHTETHAGELHQKAWPIISRELISPEHMAAREEYERLSGANPDRVARDMAAIETAVEQGRVDKLLAMVSRHTTDTVQDNVEQRPRISFPDGDHGKALNALATKVWRMSGKVIGLLPAEMPHGAPMVARLRY